MNYMLTERAAKALAKLLKDNRAFVAADPSEVRKSRPDVGHVVELFPFKVVGTDEGFNINLPSGCIVDGDTALTPGGVTATGNGDWFSIDSVGNVGQSRDAATPIYLVVKGGTATTATITGSSSATSGDDVLLVATLANVFSYTDENNVVHNLVAKQIARSTLTVGKASGGGGGGSTTGVSDYFDVVTDVAWNEKGDYALYKKYRRFTFANGVLKSVGNVTEELVFQTAKHSEQ